MGKSKRVGRADRADHWQDAKEHPIRHRPLRQCVGQQRQRDSPHVLDQIRSGGPVTVTHPDIRALLHAHFGGGPIGAAGGRVRARTGDILVLDMGEQIKILDVARNLIRLSGFVPDEEIQIKIIGLRPGEKLHEELVGKGEDFEPAGRWTRSSACGRRRCLAASAIGGSDQCAHRRGLEWPFERRAPPPVSNRAGASALTRRSGSVPTAPILMMEACGVRPPCLSVSCRATCRCSRAFHKAVARQGIRQSHRSASVSDKGP